MVETGSKAEAGPPPRESVLRGLAACAPGTKNTRQASGREARRVAFSRLRIEDVMAYQQIRDRERRGKLDELTESSEAFGGYGELK